MKYRAILYKSTTTMELTWTDFNTESKTVIKELAEDGINFERLISKLSKAKQKFNSSKLSKALEEKIKK